MWDGLDAEKDDKSRQYLTGFGSLASFISSDHDNSTAVYKSFNKLATRDLLYYQAELLELQALQDQYDLEDATDAAKVDTLDPEWVRLRQNARDWVSFKHSAHKSRANDDRWKKRMDLAMLIRATLHEYREALVSHSEVLSMSRPSKQTMTAMSKTFNQASSYPSGSDASTEADPMLMGNGAHLFPLLSRKNDLPSTHHISLRKVQDADTLTYFLKSYCSRLFRTRSAPITPALIDLASSKVTHYSIERLNFAASFITTIMSALLLFLPIYVLYHVSTDQAGLTLGLVALFTCLFAATIALVTNARRAEIFGSCAAYAAVLVVFVSGDFANSTS